MKVVSGLKFEDTIFYEEDGKKYKMIVHIRMNDECKNKICEFAITADIYELHRSSWAWSRGGCQHEAILEHAPKYKCFVELHLCNHYGYGGINSFSNALCWFQMNKIESVKDCLRLKDDEYNELQWFMDDKKSLQWKLNQMGIIQRWQQEANEAIDYLNELTGCRWVNPYSKDEEKFVMKPLTDEENKLIEERFHYGYYSEETVTIRRKNVLNTKIESQREEAIKEFNKHTSRWQEILNIKFSILDEGILLDNVIIYERSKEVQFNWKDWGVQVPKEDYDRYMAKITSECLFEDWKFSFKDNK